MLPIYQGQVRRTVWVDTQCCASQDSCTNNIQSSQYFSLSVKKQYQGPMTSFLLVGTPIDKFEPEKIHHLPVDS